MSIASSSFCAYRSRPKWAWKPTAQIVEWRSIWVKHPCFSPPPHCDGSRQHVQSQAASFDCMGLFAWSIAGKDPGCCLECATGVDVWSQHTRAARCAISTSQEAAAAKSARDVRTPAPLASCGSENAKRLPNPSRSAVAFSWSKAFATMLEL